MIDPATISTSSCKLVLLHQPHHHLQGEQHTSTHAASFASVIHSKNNLYDSQRCRSDRKLENQEKHTSSEPAYSELSRRSSIPELIRSSSSSPSASNSSTASSSSTYQFPLSTNVETSPTAKISPLFVEHLPMSQQDTEACLATRSWAYLNFHTNFSRLLASVIQEFLLQFLVRLAVELVFKFCGG